ncbi:MAG: hypothetical protein EXS13_11160 [Planctomycetes bacterium]|nr:hypothetical protein [Planctomycetota bacterium]
MTVASNTPSAAMTDSLHGDVAVPRGIAGFSDGLLRFTRLHVATTFALLAFGASVTSNDAGLAVPDWPTTYGDLNPLAPYLRGLVTGLIALEHNHRVIGMVVGLLTIVQFAWIRSATRDPLVRRLAWTLLVLVCVQGGLGGLTVHMKLPPAVSILHGMTAQAFFCLSIATAWRLSREWQASARNATAPVSAEATSLRRLAKFVLLVVFLQLFLGAIVRHTVAKQRIPQFGDLAVVVHMAFGLAVVVVIGAFVARLTASAEAHPRLRNGGLLLGALVLVQLLLGLLSVATRTDPIVTVLHVITGAAILGTALLCVLRSQRLAA